MPIAFETGGLQQLDPSTWGNPATGDLVTLAYIEAAPDLPAPLADLDTLRRGLTEQQAEFGCLIEAYAITVAGQPALLRVEKFPLADRSGLGFTAGIVLPKATCSAILKIMCRENGRSGVREAAIVPKVGFQNMFPPHPYAPEIRGQLPYNVADDAQWDTQFPDHPLTRARRWIAHVSRTAQVDPRFAAIPDFTGPSAAVADPAAAVERPESEEAESAGAPGAAETAPIPSAAALGKGPRRTPPPAPPSSSPPSIPRLPASAAAYAATPAAAKPMSAATSAVNFLQPPTPATSGEFDDRPAAETTAMPAGGDPEGTAWSPEDAEPQAPAGAPPRLPAQPEETVIRPEETTMLPFGPAVSDAAPPDSPATGSPWEGVPRTDPDETTAMSADPAQTTAIPAHRAAEPAYAEARDALRSAAPDSGQSAAPAQAGSAVLDPGQTTAIPTGAVDRYRSDPAEGEAPWTEDEPAGTSAAETTAIPFGGGTPRGESTAGAPDSDGSVSTGPVSTGVSGAAETRPIPKR
ncbi:hypothetical protein [Nocardia sp. BMG51109]|uniref:hypothetical protein n=1 Tax=Nocardia sp. BMG51109 TaxID=1056816 RepID=UPI000463B794|nr:hypothetical protein [Nocardia sp. BMG51109]